MVHSNMTRKKETGVYVVGRVNEDSRSSRRGEYFVIQGEEANNRSYIEWRPIEFLDKSKWYAIRVGPTERNTRRTNEVAHPMEEFGSKGEAVQYLEKRISFDEKY